MSSSASFVVGVDVGGTNTDAVVLDVSSKDKPLVCGSAKSPTTPDVTAGIVAAISKALVDSEAYFSEKSATKDNIKYVAVGTTHFLNAVVTRSSKLSPVAVVRLGSPATTAMPPFVDIPSDLVDLVCKYGCVVKGGFQFTGQVITEVDRVEIEEHARAIRDLGIKEVVVNGVFSPVNPEQENTVADIIQSVIPDVNITKAHEIAFIGVIERENTAILNAAVRKMARQTIDAFSSSVAELGLRCDLFLTQNDGTLMTTTQASNLPVATFSRYVFIWFSNAAVRHCVLVVASPFFSFIFTKGFLNYVLVCILSSHVHLFSPLTRKLISSSIR